MRLYYKIIALTLITSFTFVSCDSDGELIAEIEPEIETPIDASCGTEGLLESFTDNNGNNLFIYEDGKVFQSLNGECNFQLQYFDPNFESDNYETNTSGTFLKDGDALIAVKNDFTEDFEENRFIDLFSTDISDPNLFWTGFTLQSPEAKTVSEYVALSKCVLEESCDFLDNTITIIGDPANSSNQVIEFSSEAPTADMIVSKCSMSSVLSYFKKDADVWFEADYYIQEGMPYSLVDFENSYFEGSPGPRVVIRNNRLELENKFGAKLQFEPITNEEVPIQEWFTIKVHLKYSNTGDGMLELWQDGVQLISTTGINLPTSNAVQNILEIGISATDRKAILLMDNLRLSETEF